MKRLVLSAILALGVTSGARGQTVSLVPASAMCWSISTSAVICTQAPKSFGLIS
jgi:hypothetical protein